MFETQVFADELAVDEDLGPHGEEAVLVEERRELVGRDDPRPERSCRSPCPSPGPRRTFISRDCRSRADQSFMIV